MQAILRVPFSSTFPALKKIDFKINLVLDVPEGAKLPRLTEPLGEFCTLVSLAREYFPTVNLFLIHHVEHRNHLPKSE